jgi:hypothetical protein
MALSSALHTPECVERSSPGKTSTKFRQLMHCNTNNQGRQNITSVFQ